MSSVRPLCAVALLVIQLGLSEEAEEEVFGVFRSILLTIYHNQATAPLARTQV